MELSSKFDFKSIEDKWIKHWQDKNLFHANADTGKPPYTIVIPPPNVTGILHMGHALNNTLQDIIIRYKRMNGFEALWMPGTDHAGIATQNVVEKQLAKEGKSRYDVGREAFIERLWAWKKEYGDTIIHQLEKLGSSCDWPRTRFTMDDAYSEAVKHTFVELHKEGLIYRGEYIINWCPRCQTALSDEEAEHEEVNGNLYHFRYPFKDNPESFVVVATTRPETMLGDTAVAVNPEDERYKNLIGQTLILPLVNREIKIISDEFVDKTFGTGAVKVTPAHDPNDFQMGRRHKLDFINVMHPDGRINEKGGAFNGQDRFVARKSVVKALEEKGLVEKIEPHRHAVGHCYRCHSVVEPYLSKQWFVKMKPLAEPALKAVVDGDIKFYPDRWTKVYINWMEGIRDWCISRQIWWGHRIPVWYCERSECTDRSESPLGEECPPIVAMTAPTQCPKCGSKNLKQDEDVLDTWFSSWLWPFATLGWPNHAHLHGGHGGENKDLKYFYPSNSLFTASEIIFFWVARMIMAGIHFQGKIPFSDVYIHGTVRDAKGRKMSKSLGNALDPLEIINEYGADALRFSLIINSGQDLFISKEKFEIGRNFANKIWNATRLILMNVDNNNVGNGMKPFPTDLPSRWIISKFYTTLEKVNAAIESYRYSDAETLVQEFFWGNFCDWYLEIIKDKWADKNIQSTAIFILENSLKMIHPFMPFVTEEIWNHLHPDSVALSVESWPNIDKNLINESIEKEMQYVSDLVVATRNIRSQWNIKPVTVSLTTQNKEEMATLKANQNILKSLTRLPEVYTFDSHQKYKNSVTAIVGSTQISIPLGDNFDIDQEKKKLVSQIDEQKKLSQNLAQRLNNPGFTSKAPADIIAKEKERLADYEKKIIELEKVLKSLE